MTDKKTDPAALAQRLAACAVNFDPNHNHEHGTSQPPKVAFVPLDLHKAVMEALCAQRSSPPLKH